MGRLASLVGKSPPVSLAGPSEPAAGAAAVRVPDVASFAEALSVVVPGEGPDSRHPQEGAWRQLPAPCETRREPWGSTPILQSRRQRHSRSHLIVTKSRSRCFTRVHTPLPFRGS